MIQINNLSKHYGELVVLSNVNATIKKGDIITVIGPSGTGKSTFLRCLNLLETPTGGSMFIDGIPLLDKTTNVPKLRQRMGMVFQSFNLYAHLSVLENLTIGPIKLLGKKKVEAQEKGMELLRLVGLAEKANSFPDELSGGQKQRVAIARCMAMEPEILLFDEPTSALDPTMVSEVLSVIRRLSREGMTMIIVTHEMEFARNISNKVYYMDEGIIYEEGTPEQIFENPQKEKTKEFINRIRSLDFKIASENFDLYAIQAGMQSFCQKHMVTPQVTEFTSNLVEELLVLLKSLKDTQLRLSYSEKTGEITLTCENPGEPYNPFQDETMDEDIGIRIIQARCQDISYKYENGSNTLTLLIKNG